MYIYIYITYLTMSIFKIFYLIDHSSTDTFHVVILIDIDIFSVVRFNVNSNFFYG